MKKNKYPTGANFDEYLQNHLTDPVEAAAYIMAAADEGDADFLRVAIGDVVKAHGISTIADKADVLKQTLSACFGPNGNPSFANVLKVLEAVGLKFVVVPEAVDINLAVDASRVVQAAEQLHKDAEKIVRAQTKAQSKAKTKRRSVGEEAHAMALARPGAAVTLRKKLRTKAQR